MSYDADETAFTMTAPHTTASVPQISRGELYLSRSSSALIVAGHGLPLMGEGRLIVQLGRVPDGWYRTIKRKAQDNSKETEEPPKKEAPKKEPPEEKPSKEEPPKDDQDPNISRIKVLQTIMHTEPDYLSDGIRCLRRNWEMRKIEQKGVQNKVEDVKSGDVGWIHRTVTNPPTVDWSKMDQVGGKGRSVTADEVELGGRG